MKNSDYVKIILLTAILIMLFTLGVLIKTVSHRLNFPNIATNATYRITVQPGGHIWLYDGGAFDIKAMPGAIIHQNGN